MLITTFTSTTSGYAAFAWNTWTPEFIYNANRYHEVVNPRKKKAIKKKKGARPKKNLPHDLQNRCFDKSLSVENTERLSHAPNGWKLSKGTSYSYVNDIQFHATMWYIHTKCGYLPFLLFMLSLLSTATITAGACIEKLSQMVWETPI